jgi:hypothetical protein
MATGHKRMAAALAIALGAVMMTASTASAASFTITKKTEPAGDPASFNFTWEGVKQGDPNASMGSGDFTLTDGQSQTITTAGPGFYTVKEQTPSTSPAMPAAILVTPRRSTSPPARHASS